MLRISNLLRGKIPRRMPARAGLPNWDRPDPPPSAIVETDHELSDQQIVFTFFDRNMPEYFITQPEAYEGDTLVQAAPAFLKGWATFLAFASLFGLTAYFTNPGRKFIQPSEQTLKLAELNKKSNQTKQFYKWASQNELGVEITADNYPALKPEIIERPKKWLAKKIEMHNDYEKTNKEVQSYLRSVKEKAIKTVRQRRAKGEHSEVFAHETAHGGHQQHQQHHEKHEHQEYKQQH